VSNCGELICTAGAQACVLVLQVSANADPDAPDGLCELTPDALSLCEPAPEQVLLLGSDGNGVAAGRADISRSADGERSAGTFAFLAGECVQSLVPGSLQAGVRFAQENRSPN
jgi:hypothetical protein